MILHIKELGVYVYPTETRMGRGCIFFKKKTTQEELVEWYSKVRKSLPSADHYAENNFLLEGEKQMTKQEVIDKLKEYYETEEVTIKLPLKNKIKKIIGGK